MKSRLMQVSTCVLMMVGATGGAVAQSVDDLPKPMEIILEKGETETSKADVILAARRYAAFWNTGEAQYAIAALDKNFKDRTLPDGREQGTKGPLKASEGFRKIVPDLKVGIEKMIIANDHVVVHLSFDGHFTGELNGVKGNGQVVSFKGTDIYKVSKGKIIENWHIEDNLGFMKQVGAMK